MKFPVNPYDGDPIPEAIWEDAFEQGRLWGRYELKRTVMQGLKDYMRAEAMHKKAGGKDGFHAMV